MKVLIVFNHPAPYKVSIFNELSKYVDLTVLFERNKAKDRPLSFYNKNNYLFRSITLKDGYVCNEGSISSGVRNYIKKHYMEYDQIVMNGYSHLAEIKAIRFLQKHGIPYSLLINGGVIHNKESLLKKRYKTSLIKGAKFYMSPSQKSNEYLIYYGANKDKIYNYPYSNLDENEILSSEVNKNEIREKYNLPKEETIFVNASQFIDRKNNMLLLELFLNRKETLLLVGEGKEKVKYEKFIKDHNMKNVIIKDFLPKEELCPLLRACDAFVTLAKEDIFGHTTLEALANGLPVVSSNKVNSSLEYIKDGKNGFIVELENKENIQKMLTKSLYLNKKDIISSVKSNTFQSCGKALYEILKKEENND